MPRKATQLSVSIIFYFTFWIVHKKLLVCNFFLSIWDTIFIKDVFFSEGVFAYDIHVLLKMCTLSALYNLPIHVGFCTIRI